MHGFVGEEFHGDTVTHNSKTYFVPKGHAAFFHEAIKAGKTVEEALDHARNPFRVAC